MTRRGRWAHLVAWPERLAFLIIGLALAAAVVSPGSASAAPAAAEPIITVGPPPASAAPSPSAAPSAAPPVVKAGQTPRAPATKFITIAIYAPAGTAAQQATNSCVGPVEYRWGPIPPIVVEHDYCGGLNLVNVSPGQLVQITGGDISGIYRVAGRHYINSTGSMDQFDQSWGSVLLTTCINGSEEVVVALVRVR